MPEQILWHRLKHKQFYSLKFRRQHGIGNYVVDFYCPEKKAVIEVDGDTHYTDEQEILDRRRNNFLNSLGLKVLRYTNKEIMRNIEGILEDIANKLKT